MEFTHLHVYPSVAREDSETYNKRLLDFAVEQGHRAIAITGKSSLESAFEFLILAQQKLVKPIIGMEIQVSVRLHDQDLKSPDAQLFAVVVLAKNTQGISNLKELEKLATTMGTPERPALSSEVLEKHAEGLIALSGDLNSEIAKGILNGPPQAANDVIVWFKRVFKEDYYLEVTLHRENLDDQQSQQTFKQSIVNNVTRDMANLHQLKMVATNAVSFVAPDKTTTADEVATTGQEYLKSGEEMQELFKDFPGAVENTQEITEKVNY